MTGMMNPIPLGKKNLKNIFNQKYLHKKHNEFAKIKLWKNKTPQTKKIIQIK